MRAAVAARGAAHALAARAAPLRLGARARRARHLVSAVAAVVLNVTLLMRMALEAVDIGLWAAADARTELYTQTSRTLLPKYAA